MYTRPSVDEGDSLGGCGDGQAHTALTASSKNLHPKKRDKTREELKRERERERAGEKKEI